MPDGAVACAGGVLPGRALQGRLGCSGEGGEGGGADAPAAGLAAGSGLRGLPREPLTMGGAAVAPGAVLRSGFVSMAVEPGSGRGKVARTWPPGRAASVISFWLTDRNTKPGASAAPTLYVRAGWPSTATRAAPRPLADAITPKTLNRSAGPGAAPGTRGCAPSSLASASAGGTGGVGGIDGADSADSAAAGKARPVALLARVASGMAWRQRSRTASVQYAADSSATPTKAAVIQRRPDSVCRSIMAFSSSIKPRPGCKRDRSAGLRPPALRARGFTLIELMVVLVIIGVLAALIVPNVLNRADDARISAARTDVNNIMQSLRLYRLDNQRYPTAEQGLQALVTRPDKPPLPTNWRAYLERLPNDPWGQPYVYMNPGVRGEIDVLSYGADGQPGGEGKDADVGSWQ